MASSNIGPKNKSESSRPNDEERTSLPRGAWGATFKRTVRELGADNVTDWAAALTYYGMLSILPGADRAGVDRRADGLFGQQWTAEEHGLVRAREPLGPLRFRQLGQQRSRCAASAPRSVSSWTYRTRPSN